MSVINDLINVLSSENSQEKLDAILEKDRRLHLQQQKENLIYFRKIIERYNRVQNNMQNGNNIVANNRKM